MQRLDILAAAKTKYVRDLLATATATSLAIHTMTAVQTSMKHVSIAGVSWLVECVRLQHIKLQCHKKQIGVQVKGAVARTAEA